MPFRSDQTNSWGRQLTILEGMMAQLVVVVVVTKRLGSQFTINPNNHIEETISCH
jgi:hypothetical protein